MKLSKIFLFSALVNSQSFAQKSTTPFHADLMKITKLKNNAEKQTWLQSTLSLLEQQSYSDKYSDDVQLKAREYVRYLKRFPTEITPQNCSQSRQSLLFYISPNEEIHRFRKY